MDSANPERQMRATYDASGSGIIDEANRRPVAERNSRWAMRLASACARRGIRPNQISLASVAFSILAALCIAAAPHLNHLLPAALCYIAAALLIPIRLVCNLIDGLVAVEHGLRGKSGELYNELPDRVSDAVVLVAAGYAAQWGAWSVALGWGAALLAVLTAYIRALGGAAGARQYFDGPMAKQCRMTILSIACVAAAIERAAHQPARVIGVALILIAAGCVVTIARRARLIARDLEARS